MFVKGSNRIVEEHDSKFWRITTSNGSRLARSTCISALMKLIPGRRPAARSAANASKASERSVPTHAATRLHSLIGGS